MSKKMALIALTLALFGCQARDAHPETASDPMAAVFPPSNQPLPEVFLEMIDAESTEEDETSVSFRIHRTGDTANSLFVYFKLGGRSTPGVDTRISSNVTQAGHLNLVMIPAGQASALVEMQSIDDSEIEPDEDILIELTESPRGHYVLAGAHPPATTLPTR